MSGVARFKNAYVVNDNPYNSRMMQISTNNLVLDIDSDKLTSLRVLNTAEARQALSDVWGADIDELSHYFALYYDTHIKQFSDTDSFISLSFIDHGYIADAEEVIDIGEAQKQIEIDLEIINRESQWSAEESIYFDRWWPKPKMDTQAKVMEFGVSLKDFHQKVFNRTLNRLILTRYGHVLLNYSLSEADILAAKPLTYFQGKLDEVAESLQINSSYRYQDVDEDNDMPSRSRLINLILSSEIF